MSAGPCPKCGGAMTRGFIVGNTYHGRAVPTWYGGEPEPSAWQGLKISDRANFSVSSWRCDQCGLLENYAI